MVGMFTPAQQVIITRIDQLTREKIAARAAHLETGVVCAADDYGWAVILPASISRWRK